MLNVQQLSAGYGESRIVSDVSLEVPTGKVVCLMGRNGVGKTTLLKTIMGILKSKTGLIYLDGKPITHFSPNKRAQSGIGYVPQGRGIFPYLTVFENLLMGFEALPTKKISPYVIEEVYSMFPVIKTMQARVAGTLSGGQQQQLAIARLDRSRH